MPYPPLELIGRDIDTASRAHRHTQHVRPAAGGGEAATAPTRAPVSSSTTGPFMGIEVNRSDLHRLAGKQTDEWDRLHLVHPCAVVPPPSCRRIRGRQERRESNGERAPRSRASRPLYAVQRRGDRRRAGGARREDGDRRAVVYLQFLGRSSLSDEPKLTRSIEDQRSDLRPLHVCYGVHDRRRRLRTALRENDELIDAPHASARGRAKAWPSVASGNWGDRGHCHHGGLRARQRPAVKARTSMVMELQCMADARF